MVCLGYKTYLTSQELVVVVSRARNTFARVVVAASRAISSTCLCMLKPFTADFAIINGLFGLAKSAVKGRITSAVQMDASVL